MPQFALLPAHLPRLRAKYANLHRGYVRDDRGYVLRDYALRVYARACVRAYVHVYDRDHRLYLLFCLLYRQYHQSHQHLQGLILFLSAVFQYFFSKKPSKPSPTQTTN